MSILGIALGNTQGELIFFRNFSELKLTQFEDLVNTSINRYK